MQREQRILGELHARGAAVAEPFLRHERGAHAAASIDVEQARGIAVDDDVAFAARQPLARQRGEQLVLTVAGDAGDAENLAAADLERYVLEPRAVRIVGLERQFVDDETRHRGGVLGRLHLTDFGADHHPRQRRRGLLPRIAGRDFLAQAQDGRGVAQPFDLFQLVTDVENGAAFGS